MLFIYVVRYRFFHQCFEKLHIELLPHKVANGQHSDVDSTSHVSSTTRVGSTPNMTSFLDEVVHGEAEMAELGGHRNDEAHMGGGDLVKSPGEPEGRDYSSRKESTKEGGCLRLLYPFVERRLVSGG